MAKLGFEVLEWSRVPVIGEDHPDARDIPGGFEGGLVVKEAGLYHCFPTERVGRPRPSADTRLGHWTSPDGLSWTRVGHLVKGTGDDRGKDPDGVVWQATPVFDESENRWCLFYVGYTHEEHPKVGYHHRLGRIYRAVSSVPGRAGVGGPYLDRSVVLAPETDKRPWEGDQGCDSFFPYRDPTGHGWLALYGSAQTDGLPARACTFWGVGLAQAPALAGPWTRLPGDNVLDLKFGAGNRCTFMPENPLVYPVPATLGGGLVSVLDYVHGTWGNETGFVLANPDIPRDRSIPFLLSPDGRTWRVGGFIDLPPEDEQWWEEMRTPLGLIPEGADTFSLFFTAYKDYRGFSSLGRAVVRARVR